MSTLTSTMSSVISACLSVFDSCCQRATFGVHQKDFDMRRFYGILLLLSRQSGASFEVGRRYSSLKGDNSLLREGSNREKGFI